jgi:hypothetical protein
MVLLHYCPGMRTASVGVLERIGGNIHEGIGRCIHISIN